MLPDHLAQRIQAAIAPQPVAPLAPPSEYTFTQAYMTVNTKLCSTLGRVVHLPSKQTIHNQNIVDNGLDHMANTSGIERITSSFPFNRRQLVGIVFSNGFLSENLYNTLGDIADYYAVGRSLVGGNEVFSAIFRRKNYASLDDAFFGVTEAFAPVVKGRSVQHRRETQFDFTCKWAQMQTNILMSFVIITEQPANAEGILAQWHGREHFDVLADIHACETVPRNERDNRQQFVFANRTRLEAMWKALRNVPATARYITLENDSIPSLQNLRLAPSQLEVWYVDVGDNSIKVANGRDYIRTLHQTRSLIFYGDAGLHKTSVSLAFAGAIAQLYPQTGDKPARFYKVSDVEELDRGDMLPGVPIVFDETKWDEPRAHNPAHTLNDLKIIHDSERGLSLTGKGSNSSTTGIITFSDRQPRIMTSNALSPHEYSKYLPENLRSMNAGELAALSADSRALIRRMC
jgi:hypothetical protein